MTARESIGSESLNRGSHDGLDVRPVVSDRGVEHEALFHHNDAWGTVHVPEDRIMVGDDSREVREPHQFRYRPANRKTAYRIGWGWSGL